MPKPKAPIRRFDVFAEYNRQKAIEDGVPSDEAKGYGLWVAKVVASRSFGRSLTDQRPSQVHETTEREDGKGTEARPKWHSLNGKPQTDELFDKEIVARMGDEFYDEVFSPAIEKAVREDRTYTSIRDTIRREWKP